MIGRYWNIDLKEMIGAKVHVGNNKSTWDPKMTPYILFAKGKNKRKGNHITNLTKTARFLSEACDLLFDIASQGKDILIVGKRQLPGKAADSIGLAGRRARCHYVNKKWFRGMLTNWVITEKKLRMLRELTISEKKGKFNSLPKRDAAILKRKLSILKTYLGGIKYMKGLPDIVIIMDLQREYVAFRECIVLDIPTICLIDTSGDPDLVDFPIPANDNDIISIRWILNKLVSAICEGHSNYIKNHYKESFQ